MLEVSDVATLRVIAHPLRSQLLEHLDGPRTVRELGDLVGKPPDRLYYHLRLLEQHELIEVVDEQVVRGLTERRYRCTADRIRVAARGVDSAATATQLINQLLDRVQRDVAKVTALRARRDPGDEPSMALGLEHLHLTRDEHAEVLATLEEIQRRYADRAPSEETTPWAVLVGLYPLIDEESTR